MIGFGALLNPANILPTSAVIMLSEIMTFAAERRRLIARFALSLIVAVVVIARWTYRNFLAFHAFVPLRSNFGLELRIGNNPKADGTSLAAAEVDHPHMSPKNIKVYKELGELQYMKLKKDDAMRWILDNPYRFTVLTGRRIMMFWCGNEIFKKASSGGTVNEKVLSLVVPVLAFLGIIFYFVSAHRYRWTIFAATIAPVSVFAITHVNHRYNYPVSGLQLLICSDMVIKALQSISASLRGFFPSTGSPSVA